MFRSTTARFILLAFALQFLVTCGVLLFVQQTSQRVLAEEQHALIGELHDEMVTAWRGGGERELSSLILLRLNSNRDSTAVILYTRADGTLVAGNLDGWPTVITPNGEWRKIVLYRRNSERPETMGVMATQLPDGSRLLTGHVIEASQRLSSITQKAIWLALVVGMAMAMLGALVFGKLLSRKIGSIAATAHAVSGGMLAERVQTDGSGDAFDALGGEINAMLDRIGGLISQLRMMTDGLAHDLRSPVTRMKSLIERTIVDTHDAPTLAMLERISVEADMLLKMLSTALQISRAEAGIGRENFAEVDVDELLEDLVEIYGPLAEDSGFTLLKRTCHGVKAILHRELVSQAIGNLIENALKYAKGGDEIILNAREDHSALLISITDNGAGIPEDRREDALKRFGRLDPARHISGSGLGLSLVEAVARLHDGAMTLADNHPGLRVELQLSGLLRR